MTRRTLLLFSFFAGSLMLSGCLKYFYKPKLSLLPPYIHTVAIQPFSNHTQQFGLEDKLTLAIQTEFNRDGRAPVTTADRADGVVIGDITNYILEPLSYDVNHIPTQYKLTVLVTLSFLDRVKNQTMWKEPGMTGELRYFVSTSGLAGSLTEADAQQEIWDQLARDIATRTFEGPVDKTKTSLDAPPSEYNNPPRQPSDTPPAPAPPSPY